MSVDLQRVEHPADATRSRSDQVRGYAAALAQLVQMVLGDHLPAWTVWVSTCCVVLAPLTCWCVAVWSCRRACSARERRRWRGRTAKPATVLWIVLLTMLLTLRPDYGLGLVIAGRRCADPPVGAVTHRSRCWRGVTGNFVRFMHSPGPRSSDTGRGWSRVSHTADRSLVAVAALRCERHIASPEAFHASEQGMYNQARNRGNGGSGNTSIQGPITTLDPEGETGAS